ncbi:MAG: TonB-dependent receptor, partial [Acidobacteria bacterium]|nr:TonB-dependent receptor [Acidobacteriota bacterium]
VETRLAGYYGKDSTDPLQAGEPRVKPRITNNDTGQITGGISSWSDAKTWRTGVSGKISHLADRFMGGSHDLKLGVQYSGGGRDAVTGPNDYIYIVGGKQSYGYTRLPWHAGGLIRNLGTYVDDTYRLGNVVTFNLGLRYDHSQALYPSFPILDAAGNATSQFSPGNDDVYHWNVVSPRAGATWKLNESGKTVVKGYYGLLYRGIFLNDFTAAIPSVTPKYIFDITPTGARTNFSIVSSNTNLTIDPGYKDPYSHEAIVQIEQEVMPNLGLQVNYVHKQGYDYPGWQDIGGQYTQTPYVDGVGSGATGQAVTVYKLLTPFSRSLFQMTNVAGLYSRYNGVTITGTKRMSSNWQGTLSLVLSKSEGREPSSTQGPAAGQGGTSGNFGRIPGVGGQNDFVNTDGLLIGDRPVVANLSVPVGLPGIRQPAAPDGAPVGASDPRGRPWIPEQADDLHGAARRQPARAEPGSHRCARAEVDPARAAGTQSGPVPRCAEPHEQRHDRERAEPARRSSGFVRRAVAVRVPAKAATRREDQVLTLRSLKSEV